MRFLILLTAVFTLPQLSAAEKPNVIIVYTDDQGSVDANCYGATDLATPNIDRLAETGVRFTQMLGSFRDLLGIAGGFADRADACPSWRSRERFVRERQFRNAHGEGNDRRGIEKKLDMRPAILESGISATLPRRCRMRKASIIPSGIWEGASITTLISFTGTGPNRHDLWRNGKEIWQDGVYFGTSMVDEITEFIDREKDEPFFVYWAINWPHYPLQGTAKWRDQYKDLPHPRDKYAAFMSSTDDLLGQLLDHLEKIGFA